MSIADCFLKRNDGRAFLSLMPARHGERSGQVKVLAKPFTSRRRLVSCLASCCCSPPTTMLMMNGNRYG